MKVKVQSIEINGRAIDKLSVAERKALELTAHAVLADIIDRNVVPFRDSPLETSGDVEKISEDLYHIVFNTPYARRWYYNIEGVTFKKGYNPNAQDHWMDHYLDGEGKQWLIETYLKFLKQESGGVVT